MLKFIAVRFAKAQYRFRQEKEAAINELHAKLADQLAQEHRDNAAKLTKEADEMDARIKEMDEQLEKGFYECENGHEHVAAARLPAESFDVAACIECKAPVKLIKRDQMTGQEKYESDKERDEAEGITKQKRDQAKAEADSTGESEKAAKYFRGIAQNNRTVAEKLRRI